jgi:TonB family protein
VKDFAFANAPAQMVPTHKPSTLVIAVVIHALIFAVVIQVTARPVRINSAGSPLGARTVYIAGPVGAAPAPTPKPPERKTALKTEVAKNAPKDVQAEAGTGSAGVVGENQTATGPVRLGSGGSLTLVRRVQPVYPAFMQSARITGQVVLDAIIHADGTIGDVSVLHSTNEAFTRSAIAAVKQWQYSPVGFEAILTVTVNFTLT